MENDPDGKGGQMIRSRETIEVEGATVEEAIKKALGILNVRRNEILVKVVCEEKRGLFGMEGAKPAKIKVVLKDSKKPTDK